MPRKNRRVIEAVPNQEHLDILKKGVYTWNEWRKDKLKLRPDLSGAHLEGADLSGPHLSGANLEGADFSEADLVDANLSRANLSGADLSQAELMEADLSEAHLSRANLSGADLRGANLSGANLSDADLSEAHLSGADLRGANLSGANLSDADLSEAHLSGADLSGANLSDANLSDANLSQADLSRAELEGSNITLEQVSVARISADDLIDRGFIRGLLGLETDPKRTIVRQIEFRPEHHQAGLSILEYFGTVIRQKYPDIPIKVRIEQEGLKVRMVVETPEGKKEPIEKALTDYGLVVVGKKHPSDLLEDRLHILRLEQTLELEKVRHNSTLRLLETEQRHSEQLSGRYDQLLGFLGEKLLQQPQATSLVVNVEVLPKLRDSLRESERLTAEQRQEALDLLDQLRVQVELAEKDRLDKGTLGKMFGRLGQLAGMAGAAASIWQTFGPQIGAVLGIVSK